MSVIVPVRNRPQDIARCLDSLLASDYPTSRLELICVDNASTDATPAVLRGYNGRVRIVTEPTLGPAAARNAGVREASGDLIAFTDSDCVVDREWVRRIVAPLSDESIGIVGGRILAQEPCSSVGLFGEMIHDHRRAILGFTPPYAITMNIAMRRDVLRTVGGFDERLLRVEDVDLTLRVLRQGFRLEYCDQAVIYHRNRDTVRSLMREGFLHGYYAPRIDELHGDFVGELVRRARAAPPAEPIPAVVPRIAPWKARLFAKLFYTSRAAGKAANRRWARQLPQPCTTSGI